MQIRASSASTEILGPPAAFIAARAASSSVASASTQQVASGISRRLRASFSATAPRIPRSGMRLPPARAPAAAGCPAPYRGGRCSRRVRRRSTSARRISPSGPEPVSARRSRPCSRASRRTSGEMTATGPSCPTGAAAAATGAGPARSRDGHGTGRRPGPGAPGGAGPRGRPCRSRPARCRTRFAVGRCGAGPSAAERRRPSPVGGAHRDRHQRGARRRGSAPSSPKRAVDHAAVRAGHLDHRPWPSRPRRSAGRRRRRRRPAPASARSRPRSAPRRGRAGGTRVTAAIMLSSSHWSVATASRMRSTPGRWWCSSFGGGYGMSKPVTRRTGASRWWKQRS